MANEKEALLKEIRENTFAYVQECAKRFLPARRSRDYGILLDNEWSRRALCIGEDGHLYTARHGDQSYKDMKPVRKCEDCQLGYHDWLNMLAFGPGVRGTELPVYPDPALTDPDPARFSEIEMRQRVIRLFEKGFM